MKSTRLIMSALAASIMIFATFSSTLHAAQNAANISGDLTLKQDALGANTGIHFSNGTYQNSASPWSYSNFDIYFNANGGNVGIGTPTPTATLEVKGDTKVSGTLTVGNLGANTVTSTAIAAGAVTDASITGPISASKLDLSTVQMKYGKVAVVAQSGGDYTNPLAAMTALASWCGVPTANNTCLLKIMPGTYDLWPGTLVMQPYVDIEGSGENVTFLISAVVNPSSPPANGVVNGASNAEIRFLTVQNAGGLTGNYVAGMVNSNGASPKMTHITVTATGGIVRNFGVFNNSSSPTMTNVTASSTLGVSAANIGVYNSNSSPIMNNVVASSANGTNNYAMFNVTSSSPTMNNVLVAASGGTGINVGVTNTSSSPTMKNVTISATGGTATIGVNNNTSAPIMNNVTVSATGGTGTNRGVINSSSLTSIMNNVNIIATGGTDTTGVTNSLSSPNMNNVTASGTNGSNSNYGMVNSAASGAYTINIDRSSFTGATNSILSDITYSLRIGASKLEGGGASGLGSYTCVGVYNGNDYTPLGPLCL